MQTEALKELIKTLYRDVTGKLPDFSSRYTQRLFIAEIVKTLTNSQHAEKLLAVEGPTGTGKTLAYLVACIPTAQELQKKLIISTATVALQTQLLEKDIPLVSNSELVDIKLSLVKGRRRYLCPSLLEQQLAGDNGQTEVFASDDFLSNTFRELRDAFYGGDWGGDKDNWHREIGEDIWQKISNDRHGCLAAKCQHFRECPYFKARLDMEEADVLVVNHDLLLSDLSLGGGILLPPPAESIYVIDEAHHLPDKTINHAGNWASLNGTLSWLDRTSMQLKQIEASLMELDIGKLITDSEQSIIKIKSHIATLSSQLNQVSELNSEQEEVTWRFPRGEVTESLRIQTDELNKVSNHLLIRLNNIKDIISKAVNKNEIPANIAEALLPELGVHISRLENLVLLLNSFSHQDNPQEPPTARWITRVNNKELSDFRMASSPTSATQFLQTHLWQQCFASIMTSATLVSLGSFGYYQRKTGLDALTDARYIQLASPFDFKNNATLWIPAMNADPGDQFAHTNEIIRLLPELLTQGEGTLVLFSSRRQMEEVADRIPDEWRQCLLVQGEYSLGKLLEKHKNAITNHETSVIFGLASFAEGIDLPGNLCQHVIIAKLPFPVPDSPVDATEREFIEAQGKSHFREIVLPQTSIRLIQAVGRLIRKESDTGRVTILDRRLVSKSYGRTLLKSLPDMRQVIE